MRAWMLSLEVSWRRVRLREIIKVVVVLRLVRREGITSVNLNAWRRRRLKLGAGRGGHFRVSGQLTSSQLLGGSDFTHMYIAFVAQYS